MASYAVHLAVANVYLEKNKNENREDFINGTIDVDYVDDKVSSHYTGNIDKSNLKRFLSQKVILPNYVKKNQIDTSYNRGYFLHLLTDYYFYNEFFNKAWIDSIDYSKFKEVMYNEYPLITDYLKEKYTVIFPKRIEKYSFSKKGNPIILTNDSIGEFIDFIGNIDLNQTYSTIKNDLEGGKQNGTQNETTSKVL